MSDADKDMKRKRLLEECAMLEKIVKEAEKSKQSSASVQPIIQSYKVFPSFANKSSYLNHGLKSLPHRPLRPNFPKPKTFYRPHEIVRPPFANKWVKTLGNIHSSTAANKTEISIIKSVFDNKTSSINSIEDIKTNPPPVTENERPKIRVISNFISNSKPYTLPSVSFSGTGMIKPIVKLNSKARFRLVKLSKEDILKQKEALKSKTSDNVHDPSKYKLDRRVTIYKSPKEIARRTIIGGLNLSQRRMLIARTNATFQSKMLKSSFSARKSLRKSFIVKQYSIKRIRKSSFRSNSQSSPIHILKGTYKLITNGEKKESSASEMDENNATESQLELCSLSMSQNASIRLATRYIQRSKKRLTVFQSRQKAYCVFFNRTGTCKRKDEGRCTFVHDLKQLQICSKFLNKGVCELTDCKLSHDLNEGKRPQCRFFNDGKCSRENCRYSHLVVLANKKKKEHQMNLPAILKTKKKMDKKEESENIEDNKARYFEISPNSQPIVAIIPRRYPKSLQIELSGAKKDQEKDSSSGSSETDFSDDSVIIIEKIVNSESVTGKSKASFTNGLCHQKLINPPIRTSELILKKIEETSNNTQPASPNVQSAPTFIKFNSFNH